VSDPKIVASGRNQVHPGSVPSDSSGSWAVLGWIGLAFLVVGGSDFALVWFPLNFGNPEWEFGTVTQSFNGLPILLLGLGLLVAGADQVGRRWWGEVSHHRSLNPVFNDIVRSNCEIPRSEQTIETF
jgi:hypothetical protein